MAPGTDGYPVEFYRKCIDKSTPLFTSWVKLLYNGESCVVTVVGGGWVGVLTLKGIRQGCLLSGQLYSLAIKPFFV